jgi:hypothetical protein
MGKHITEKEVNYAQLYSPSCRRCNMVKANDIDYCKKCLSEKGGIVRRKRR